jgi:hypothetical protein
VSGVADEDDVLLVLGRHVDLTDGVEAKLRVVVGRGEQFRYPPLVAAREGIDEDLLLCVRVVIVVIDPRRPKVEHRQRFVVVGGDADHVPGPDTGSLRDDVIALLHQANERRARMAMDLLRHDVLMTLQQVSGRTIEEIVDTIFLPLLHRSSAATTHK